VSQRDWQICQLVDPQGQIRIPKPTDSSDNWTSWWTSLSVNSVSFFSRWSDVTESTVTIRSPFCGYNLAWCVELKAKLYEVIHIKLNQFTKMPIRSLAYCIKRIKALLQWATFFGVLPTRWRRKPAGIDTEPNYITLTLCISLATKLTLSKLQRQSILTSC